MDQPRGRKTKIVARVRLQDESMVVGGGMGGLGGLADTFRFDILAASMEQIPELEVGTEDATVATDTQLLYGRDT